MTEVEDSTRLLSEGHFKPHSSEKDDLVAQLDQLLERYLHTLDEYDKLQRDLSKQLSSVREKKLSLRVQVSNTHSQMPRATCR